MDRRFVPDIYMNHPGLELLEINSNQNRTPSHLSTPSLFDSSDTSKGVSPTSLYCPPPRYEEVFPDFPPSYSEISLSQKNVPFPNMKNADTYAMTDICVNMTTHINVNMLRNVSVLNISLNEDITTNENNDTCQSPGKDDDQINNNL